jgi:hypothetical protein
MDDMRKWDDGHGFIAWFTGRCPGDGPCRQCFARYANPNPMPRFRLWRFWR